MSTVGQFIALDEHHLLRVLSAEIDLLICSAEAQCRLNIAQYWALIHYWLCEDINDAPPPEGYVIPMRSEQSIINQSPEFPAYFLMPEQVQLAAEYLNTLDDLTLKAMFNLEKMSADAVYPLSSIHPIDPEQLYREVYQHLSALKTFYRHASTHNQGLIFYLAPHQR